MKIGFIGLGNVGGKLADTLLRNGFDLTVRDLDPALEHAFSDQGARIGASPAEIMRDVDFLITCLPSPAASATAVSYTHLTLPTKA